MLPGKFLFRLIAAVFLVNGCSTAFAQNGQIEIPFSEGYGHAFAVTQSPYVNDYRFSKDETPLELSEKSPSKAFLLSMLLPGMGEAYVGNKTQSKIFLGIELVSWGLVAANMIHVSNRESDYKNFATQHAGINRTGKEDQYWIDIGKYDLIYEYNEQRRRDRDINALYEENGFYYWQWDSRANRLFYDKSRIDTRELERNRLYIYAAIALNHLVSGINALRLANAHNREIKELSFNLDFDYNPNMGKFSLSFHHSF
ncbi:MAG: hypothetical protein E4H13_11900 [Calditrichales bacterium]|nr:MAG: hypothetical protein E4H13_11900 [Calditrichales bacterium]